jgi:hypothetical protein
VITLESRLANHNQACHESFSGVAAGASRRVMLRLIDNGIGDIFCSRYWVPFVFVDEGGRYSKDSELQRPS